MFVFILAAPAIPQSEKILEIGEELNYSVYYGFIKLGEVKFKITGKNKEDKIDYSAGIIINKNINDKVNVGDTVLTLYTNREVPSIDKDKLFTICNNINNDIKLIYEVIK